MKIAFHDNGLGLRGTSVALFDYAYYSREILGIDPIIIHKKNNKWNVDSAIQKFKNEFPVYSYENNMELDKLLETNKIDSLFMIKGGKKDGVGSKVCKNLINAITVCNQNDIHGDIFAMGSKWLSKITNYTIPYVPYMINLPNVEGDMRQELNIPKKDIVLGRNGGWETFDIPFVKEAINEILNERKDIWFIFQFTEPFINNERVIFLPASPNMETKVKFINTCDAMIHARIWGESFGLSCGEFSTKNKPVITFKNSNEQSHNDILGDKGIYYQNKNDITEILRSIDKNFILNKEWNAYQEYTPKIIMEKFKEVYL